MAEELNTYVGQRIRFIRKSRRMSIQQLADKIGKSKACVSKYETGEITLDIPTLFEISNVLDVVPAQLINYTVEKPIPKDYADSRSSFFKAHTLYFYYSDGRFKDLKTIKEGFIHIHNPERKNVCEADFTIRFKADSGLTTEIYYAGTVTYSDMLIRFSMQNQFIPLEEDLLYIFNPLENRDSTFGLLTGISSADLMPCAFKCIVSLVPLEHDDNLHARLQFTKDEIAQLKKRNILSVANNL